MNYKCDIVYEWPYVGDGGWEGKRGVGFSFLEQLGVLYAFTIASNPIF